MRERLEAGRSMESIARELGKSASTVAYWVNKHGLVSQHAARHAGKGALDERLLRELVEQGLSVRQIAEVLDRSATSVKHWLKRYGLRTDPARYARRDQPKPESVLRECPRHGWVPYRLEPGRRVYRCNRCASERVTQHRRRVKATLIREAGGACVLCGYDRSAAALQFHHVDPSQKRFNISLGGITRSLDAAREELRKCVLLCANCHAEVEVGVANLPAAWADIPG